MPEESLNPTGPRKDLESDDLLAGLGGLKPAIGQIERDQFFFRAGQASAESAAAPVFTAAPRKHAWRWPLTTAAAAMLSAVVTLSVDRSLRLGERMVARESTAEPVETSSIGKAASPRPTSNPSEPAAAIAAQDEVQHTNSPHSYLALRRLVASRGIDALPATSFDESMNDPPAPPVRRSSYRDSLIQYPSKL